MPLKLWKRGKVYYLKGTIRGQRYYESARTSSKPHAEAQRVKREREILDAEFLGEARTTLFAQAAAVYMEKGGERRFLPPLIERWGKWRLAQITPAVVSAYATQRYPDAKASTVRRHIYVPLNAVMKCANENLSAPLVVFRGPKVKRKMITDYADDRWLEAFFAHAHFRIAATVLFLTLTAARVTEACRLEPNDVLLDGGEAILRMTKNGKPRRVPLSPVLVDALSTAIKECAKVTGELWVGRKRIDGKLVGGVKVEDATLRVFGYAERYEVGQAISRVCKRAGIKRLTSHQVGRHAFAARLLAQGKSLKLVQEAGGWSQIQVVSESYGHLEKQAIDDAVRDAGATVPRLPPPKKKVSAGEETV